MAFRVVIRHRAQADIRSIVAWRRQRDRAGAAAWRDAFMGAVVSRLRADPHSYPSAHEAETLGLPLRELLHGRKPNVYRILFTVRGQTVQVLRVRHAAQDRLAPGDI